MTADQPRIVDQAAHDERVDLDARIRALTDKLKDEAGKVPTQEHHQGLLELQGLQAKRKAAFRREVGWQG